MDYTTSGNFATAPNGQRLHTNATVPTTRFTPKDANGPAWELLEVIKEAGLAPAAFDPLVPSTYSQVLEATRRLTGFRAAATNAALRATAGTTAYAVATLCRAVAGDGGQGEWSWDAASVAADDDVLVVMPTGQVGAGRWVRYTARRNELGNAADAAMGAALVGYSPALTYTAGTGKVLGKDLFAGVWPGMDTTGATNTTAALLAWYTACIDRGVDGYLPTGTYKVTPGVLKFNNGGVGKRWPNIRTAGYREVKFLVDSATNVNAPILEWTSVSVNGDHGSYWVGDAYWYGGCHEGVSFEDTTNHTAPLRNAISLCATWALRLGYMAGKNLRASTVHVPVNTVNGTNPDPFANSFLRSAGMEGVGNVNKVFENLNGVGFDSAVVETVRGILCQGGAWYGIGQGCWIEHMSVGSCAGWAFHDGTQGGALSVNRNTIKVCEFDDVQYGIYLNKHSITTFEDVRFNHRWNFSPLNTSGLYWPRTCIQLSAGVSPNVKCVKFLNVTNRFEPGGTLGDLGVFFNGASSGNFADIRIEVDYSDNSGLGVPVSWFTTGMGTVNTSTPMLMTYKSKALIDTRDKGMSFAVGATGTTLIPNTGWTTTTLAFPTQQYATYTPSYDTGTGLYKAKRAGLHMVHVALPISGMPAGTLVRICLVASVGGASCASYAYAYGTGNQTYTLNGVVNLALGEELGVSATQNFVALISVDALLARDVRFVVHEV